MESINLATNNKGNIYFKKKKGKYDLYIVKIRIKIIQSRNIELYGHKCLYFKIEKL